MCLKQLVKILPHDKKSTRFPKIYLKALILY